MPIPSEAFLEKTLFIGVWVFYFAALAGFFFLGWHFHSEQERPGITAFLLAYLFLAFLCFFGGYGTHKYWTM